MIYVVLPFCLFQINLSYKSFHFPYMTFRKCEALSHGQINGSNPSHLHVGRIQFAQLVCNHPNNEMEDEVTIDEADQYFWLH